MKLLVCLSIFAANLGAQKIPTPKPMSNPPAASGEWTAVADTGVFSSLTIVLEERASGFIGGEWHGRLFGCTTLPICQVAGVVTGSREAARLSLTLHESALGSFGARYEATLTDSSEVVGTLQLTSAGQTAGVSWARLQRKTGPPR